LQKTSLPQAIYYGANSFAKEKHRESLALVTSQLLKKYLSPNLENITRPVA
jgi:hypothetical protein